MLLSINIGETSRTFDTCHGFSFGKRQNVGNGALGDNAVWVNRRVRRVVVRLDGVKVGRIFEGWVLPVQGTEPLVNVRITGANRIDVGLEVPHVDRVETDDRGVEANVRFRQAVPEDIRSAIRQNFLHPVERLEERVDILEVGLLRRGKATLVHPIVDLGIHPRMEVIDLRLQILGVECEFPLVFRQELIKGEIQVTDDFGRLVVYDRFQLVVPNHRHGAAQTVLWVRFKVEIADTPFVLMARNGARSGNVPRLQTLHRLERPALVRCCAQIDGVTASVCQHLRETQGG